MLSLFLHDYSWDVKHEAITAEYKCRKHNEKKKKKTGLPAGFVSTEQNVLQF